MILKNKKYVILLLIEYLLQFTDIKDTLTLLTHRKTFVISYFYIL